ncbi:MAG: hypothetical protein IPF55_06750 [Rhodoferax sp.]|nr:hypothetical protein [Rhodoferax sp.]
MPRSTTRRIATGLPGQSCSADFLGRVLAVYTAVARGITVVSLNVANFESSGGVTLDPCNNT